MKTKIIYISGNETFEMADIRAAFDEVRATLGLGSDTVLFGVPVDNDDALGVATDTHVTDATDDVHAKSDTVNEVITPEVSPIPQELSESTDAAKEIKVDNDEKIIPILSILASGSDVSDVNEDESSVSDDSHSGDELIVDDDIRDDVSTGTAQNESDVHDTETVSITDIITDDAPTAPMELEDLLESMAPLHEDTVTESGADFSDTQDDALIDTPPAPNIDDGSDATLEQLAAEFAEKQDDIPEPETTETHSKIGKLKNILPFKKAKREDPGIMGDLFGWAGIAANDDDFSIPGFFTKAASKK